MVGILELLKERGLDTSKPVKVIRHQDKRYDLALLQREGHFDTYQSYQATNIFNCDFVVSFIGLDYSRALFFGVYHVAKGPLKASDHPLPPNYPYPNFGGASNSPHKAPDGLFWVLNPVAGFDDLKDRVVINWGLGAKAFCQFLIKPPAPPRDKEVTEILPKGYVSDFPGYEDFILTFQGLVEIVNNPDANREWHRKLAAVGGVYLIQDGHDGKQYVGSASGEEGILGRWRQYAQNKHGGNKQLKLLIEKGGEKYAHNFKFTILRTLPRRLTQHEVVAYEMLYMKKLGSKAFGLNTTTMSKVDLAQVVQLSPVP